VTAPKPQGEGHCPDLPHGGDFDLAYGMDEVQQCEREHERKQKREIGIDANIGHEMVEGTDVDVQHERVEGRVDDED
jgi:hypothetical protein